jgi:hypothetical protein
MLEAGEELGVAWEMAGRSVGDVWEILSDRGLHGAHFQLLAGKWILSFLGSF